MERLTQERLKELLHYDSETGVFTWKVSSSSSVKVGSVAGSLTKAGYVEIGLDGISYLAHRLAYLYMEGYFPEHDVDHEFGIKNDNRWSKIRQVTRACNCQNKKIRSNNTSGFTGVNWNKVVKMWEARITVRKTNAHLGFHKTSLDAALARLTVEMQCPLWSCDSRNVLASAIKSVWPEFKAPIELRRT